MENSELFKNPEIIMFSVDTPNVQLFAALVLVENGQAS